VWRVAARLLVTCHSRPQRCAQVSPCALIRGFLPIFLFMCPRSNTHPHPRTRTPSGPRRLLQHPVCEGGGRGAQRAGAPRGGHRQVPRRDVRGGGQLLQPQGGRVGWGGLRGCGLRVEWGSGRCLQLPTSTSMHWAPTHWHHPHIHVHTCTHPPNP